ncbi:hypothetical protein A2334_03650 [Candidatus Roizmanbacteria bacterium RIFOXYB2_FULL_38_10]|uniref:FAD-binding FR-type domain-containing protein n=1 Tax=Candidatus Roizmanbacteria bacterium RIFOXYD1_FULL_38_12 TaxID=1802093 RepID=A0A1F7L0V7_9BACT|nr:MAG: hypothetical protein A3K47_03195 [Candidatus Roizmanbacteria bacterium RIFOXYA2_FULL_38_14]OGK63772.1 MAG: hypothetical protein A3K27_03195 [Candidatus Roizmanbacteria bacterium RIFOXYA1_FULL_37_12]OGK65618.1 MAG: hypothetical protein A3K38_03195 [Candidatus Roizmanbacteria bacterium RIFOXYB1_FULL_40_23]OGK67494.1 MAG: hypothetical protein A2334_03650 [Candidatus Roizmanbacteria bacterium RIFOXYB2_FULL_38_10]OGK73765.1 MAG: hypothetical protein A3K52_03195 [Candidatus Roizmanbacteria ba
MQRLNSINIQDAAYSLMKTNKGKNIIFASVFITIILWFFSKTSFSEILDNPLLSLSQIFSLIGLLLMMTSLILTTRIRKVEDFFGGLDRVYGMHHIIGSVSFVLLINHPLLLAVKALPNISLALQYMIPGSFLPYNLGIFALYVMITGLLFIVFIRLPYHVWKGLHTTMGFAGIMGATHALLITSDIAVFLPLRVWMIGWIILGFLGFIYILIFYDIIGPLFTYEITKLDRVLDVVNIYAKPIRKKIEFVPGQFAYISFSNEKLGSEQHPYSFSSAPEEKEIRITAKMFGDYTVKLPFLRVGDRMYLKGPYGKFGDVYIEGKKPLVWIVGGIGVTPFLSMLRHHSQLIEERKILLFYCFSTKEEAIFSDEIKRLISEKKSIEAYEWCSAEKGRFSVNKVLEILEKYHNYDVQICGPGTMIDNLQNQFREIDVDENRVLFERFQMV